MSVHTATKTFTGTCDKGLVVTLTPTELPQHGVSGNTVFTDTTHDSGASFATDQDPIVFTFGKNSMVADVTDNNLATAFGTDGVMKGTTVNLDQASVKRFPELRCSTDDVAYSFTIREKNATGGHHITEADTGENDQTEHMITDDFAKEVCNFINGLMCRRTARPGLRLETIFIQLSVGDNSGVAANASSATGYYP